MCRQHPRSQLQWTLGIRFGEHPFFVLFAPVVCSICTRFLRYLHPLFALLNPFLPPLLQRAPTSRAITCSEHSLLALVRRYVARVESHVHTSTRLWSSNNGFLSPGNARTTLMHNTTQLPHTSSENVRLKSLSSMTLEPGNRRLCG
jgi:hypothetical protein